ncbi:hypothetical protein [Streptomyces sp. NPDC001315]|uniref:hypothetical protein n=1 Tax=Streptomyces sp. NPDC001315 TaxID=3364562 RepID=UPI00367DB87E
MISLADTARGFDEAFRRQGIAEVEQPVVHDDLGAALGLASKEDPVDLVGQHALGGHMVDAGRLLGDEVLQVGRRSEDGEVDARGGHHGAPKARR